MRLCGGRNGKGAVVESNGEPGELVEGGGGDGPTEEGLKGRRGEGSQTVGEKAGRWDPWGHQLC